MTMLDGLGFPEALRWRGESLWFSDMFRSRVMRWQPGRPAETVLDLEGGGPTMPGGLGWLPDGSLLVVDCTERRLLREHDGTVTTHADLSGLMTHSANDMHVDPDGTAWVGGYGFDPEADEPVAAPLVRVHPDGTVSTTAAAFVFANGCEREASGALLVAETFADRVSALSSQNELSVRARLASGSGPDGLSIAPDGTVYVALAFAGALVRLASADAGPDAAAELVHAPKPIADGPGAGPLGVYDCAVHPDGTRIAVAMASLDEALAERVDTGRIVLLDL
ncbi:MAG: SMP-30/gluconolactonase/LRE family protein [Microcella sp.]|uniref:SMP-30/gluconolactonase/LRE family protein n=1 Tax=Microcella sp. TaxID=1913979 RepID=UPI0024C7D0FB|nr:SMP-30/gluconolactonase/LRE family protein [Microcella sp.]UYN82908.1 MAG: SMP-30/gluconolactonase/LRE family protein [Microcella sp.]